MPVVLYMHENQLTYPLPADATTGPMRRQLGERDLHYAFINYASMLAADRVFFNSHYHLESYFAALPNFLRHYPEHNELGTVRVLRARSQVLPVGLDLDWASNRPASDPVDDSLPPLVLWNQRWEYDKNPDEFFAALYQLAEEGYAFRLALCGQQFGRQPAAFATAVERLGKRIVHVGYAQQSLYRQLLWEAAVTASTADHEFFGISILEAIAAQTFPLLPARLSYPELIPEEFHQACLYQNREQLIERLRWVLAHPAEAQTTAARLATTVERFNWRYLGPIYDATVSELTVA
jgi:glycosyltransferase involved in cell wall biosynthesis